MQAVRRRLLAKVRGEGDLDLTWRSAGPARTAAWTWKAARESADHLSVYIDESVKLSEAASSQFSQHLVTWQSIGPAIDALLRGRKSPPKRIAEWLAEDASAGPGDWEELKADLDRDRRSYRKLFGR
jgi:hypothetical protein